MKESSSFASGPKDRFGALLSLSVEKKDRCPSPTRYHLEKYGMDEKLRNKKASPHHGNAQPTVQQRRTSTPKAQKEVQNGFYDVSYRLQKKNFNLNLDKKWI